MSSLQTSVVIAMLCISGCRQRESNPKDLQRSWLDSIIQTADSSYSKAYQRSDLDKTFYYRNTKDSTLTEVMKDSAGNVRQVIIMRKDLRVFHAQYYANGNIQADLPLDGSGRYQGTASFYHSNGKLQSTGSFSQGLKTGEWKIYNDKGELVATDRFDQQGQLIQQSHP